MIRTALIPILLAFAGNAIAGNCVADTPAMTSQWVHAHDRDLNPPKKSVRRALSDELFALLKKEHECVVREQGVCALDADLWTETQDGRIVGPIAFQESERGDASAVVKMKYKFSLEDNGSDAKNWTTTVRLTRKTQKSCWTVDDIIGPDGTSLKTSLLQYK